MKVKNCKKCDVAPGIFSVSFMELNCGFVLKCSKCGKDASGITKDIAVKNWNKKNKLRKVADWMNDGISKRICDS